MKIKNFLREHKSGIFIGISAIMAGVLSFVITLNVYPKEIEKRDNDINLTENITETSGKVKVYIDEPINNYDEIVLNEEKEFKTQDERQIYKNINVDERVTVADEIAIDEMDKIKEELMSGESAKEDIIKVVEAESDKLEIKEPIKQENESEKKLSFVYPVSGDITLDYAKDKLIYSETLEEWITHDGIDIKVEFATPVKSSEDGIVESIKMDPRYGNTIIISHENNYKTVYSNLSTLDMVYVGQKVKKDEIISSVGEGFGFESKEGAHLHFEIINEKGETLDVINFL